MARRRRASKIEILFETHSTTTDNERWVASGWLDGQLSPLGRRQAKELGDRRVEDEIVAVYCSDLGRAVETAQIAFGGRGLPIFHDWRLRECNYGMLNGTAVARLEVERTKHVLDPYSGGESYTDVVARARSFLQDLPPRYPDKQIVVIGHSATKWALDHLLEGAPLDELVEESFRWQPGWLYTLAIDA
jgi:2,3-bisphosphoglycerate-dependent phosphoglycerate mutase